MAPEGPIVSSAHATVNALYKWGPTAYLVCSKHAETNGHLEVQNHVTDKELSRFGYATNPQLFSATTNKILIKKTFIFYHHI